ncbi:DNA polymerase/3'-5' exonuclease PolX [Priestia flexa]|uniref:DNA-directed DNA polymerase n=1 Tax=Priestia flexa TaxID=86664 RepID=A0ABU4J8V3_9BACI|nr:DNA polymerase/3'-5' exonuclease PolX [Priestia flexa]MCG7311635.1 DNA polymerase/3'-5' exonuclease PolX [Priestia flexa]MCM3065017.1 DNA polymerase/3'-5' exonuclease PolX [Priestia flexa]MDW8517431.1 DNA polymerase/3'-5' exonuclease PolX [Priestia flexa]MED4587608.1 DNA polymerase/3'-5' exonuclease PolX [Priestia flexa]QCS51747.1 DNA polymerase/3'-5' exonuclease PolX [Priestia flexa]
MNKKDVIKLLETIATYMELKGDNPFKISAFRKAAAALESDERSLSDIEDVTALQGIGKGTATVIEEFREKGQSSVLDELKKEVPEGLVPLLKLPGLGGKKIAKLYKELDIVDIISLEEACHNEKVQGLAGFGKKTEEKILAAIAEYGKRPERLPLAFMLPIAEEILGQLEAMTDIIRYSQAGSIRRMKETVKDLDFIISTENPAAVREQLVSLPLVKDIISNGDTKVSVTLGYDYDVSVDFRLVEDQAFVTTLHHFTGSKDHNVRMRQLAKENGEKISEYGVENIETGEIQTFETEEAFYHHFGLAFIPPEVREDGREVDIFTKNQELLKHDDIKGDLHMHSTWSDGGYSLEEMAEACRAKGYEYMAITDHSQYLKVANGLTPERIRKQREEVKRLNEKYTDFTILAGIEMDILPDGTLDYEDELLAEMDFVIASIHSSFSQSREDIMMRLKNALTNQHVDLIAHPTGRLIGRREGYDVDINLLISLAKETDTALELNANPNRLDLAAEHIKKAQEAGVKIAINTDAHNLEMLEDMKVGVSTGVKGWLKPQTVLNTYSLDELKVFLNRHKE